jgi:hypothetical protein
MEESMSKERLLEAAKKASLDREYSPNVLSTKAINHVNYYEKKIIQEIEGLMNIIAEVKKTDRVPEYEKFKKAVFEKIAYDKEIAKKLKTYINNLPPALKEKLSIPVTSNKIFDSILLAEDFLKEHFDAIFDSKLPMGYNAQKREEVLYPISYDEDTIWGSAKSVQLQVALFYMATVISGKDRFAEIGFPLYKNRMHFADEAAMAHIEPIPEAIDYSKIEGIKNFSWFFADSRTSQGLLTIPCGYTFGGGRGSSRNPRDIDHPSSEQPTHDCSSFVGDVCEVRNLMQFSTADQYIAYAYKAGNPICSKAPSEEIVQKFDSVPRGSFNQLTKDLVYGHRVINVAREKDAPFGQGGHTGIVLGDTEAGKVAIVSNTRDIDTLEAENIKERLKTKVIGYGVQEFSLSETMKSDTVVTRPFLMKYQGNNR